MGDLSGKDVGARGKAEGGLVAFRSGGPPTIEMECFGIRGAYLHAICAMNRAQARFYGGIVTAKWPSRSAGLQ